MPYTKDQVVSAALQLTPAERVEIADRLMESLHDDDESKARDAAMLAEAKRRYEAYQRGEVKAYPIEEALARYDTRVTP